MKTILKKGTKIKPEDKVYFMRCGTCGCEFTYQLKDTYLGFDGDCCVGCPQCGYDCYFIFKRKYNPPQQNNFFTKLFRK